MTAAREHELASLARQLPVACWIQRVADGALTCVNPAFERLYGCTQARLDAEPRAWLSAVHPADRALVEVFVAGAAEDRSLEYRLVGAEGASTWVEHRQTPVRDAGGAVGWLVGHAIDITARRRELGRTVHELNNLIGGLQLLGDLVAGHELPAEVRRDVESMAELSRRAVVALRRLA